ncbi:hypothetical protein [Streptomyces sp. YKOK-J1]
MYWRSRGLACRRGWLVGVLVDGDDDWGAIQGLDLTSLVTF